MMTVDLTPEAKGDLFDAVDYYESKELGLGKRLRDEVASMLGTIASAPYLWRERESGYRRVNCPVFPYYVAYVIRDCKIVVVAIAASRRKPGYWQSRMKTK
ncbi:type II toxin-antitoxin system RelE/ParE family toxin [Verrucomicrobiaceae bacterium N1E253]|uniref:Type II toxin-antitoxin system RelE/ParE family toxin n=1 Tax=Oceaniferula marina TaxID=2748318 RepID=A0A851GRQ7_9BACT|nr:type II toxin-antitoxin system RelE/ParE family toxin [Oceaniferula marina]NWK57805.1 type II toxin-antitoxin system RelE/ParE family toxin [Oceaniferula marina]